MVMLVYNKLQSICYLVNQELLRWWDTVRVDVVTRTHINNFHTKQLCI